MTQSQKN